MADSDPTRQEPSGPFVETVSQDSHFSDLGDGYLPAAEPAQPAPAGDVSGSSGAAAPATPSTPAGQAPGSEPSAPAAAGAAPTPPPEKTWKVNGKDYTLKGLEEAGLLDNVGQVAHFQGIYEEEKRKREALEAAQAAREQPAAPAQSDEPSSEQLHALYSPVIAQAVQDGVIEEELAVAYPKGMARMFYLSDLVANQANAINGLLAWAGNIAKGSKEQQSTQQVIGLSQKVAARGPLFAPLSEPAEMQKFWTWIKTNIDPPMRSLTEESVAALWAAYKSNDFLAIGQAATEAQKAQEAERARNAQGEGGGPRPGALPDPDAHQKGLDEMGVGFLPPLKR